MLQKPLVEELSITWKTVAEQESGRRGWVVKMTGVAESNQRSRRGSETSYKFVQSRYDERQQRPA
jgi:hypothetical protein